MISAKKEIDVLEAEGDILLNILQNYGVCIGDSVVVSEAVNFLAGDMFLII